MTFGDFDRPWIFGNMMASARARCLNVAYSERCLGYTDTAAMYEEMAEEFKYLAGWTLGQKHVPGIAGEFLT